MAELGIEIPEGQPGELEGGAAGLSGAAGTLESAEGALAGSATIGGWEGVGAVSYENANSIEAQAIAFASQVMAQANVAISRASRALEEARSDAKAALADARDAQERIERAREAIAEAQARASEAQAAIDTADHQIASSSMQGPPDPGAVAARAQASDAFFAAKDDEERARRQLEEAQEDLERARERAREANMRWEQEAWRSAAEIQALADSNLRVGAVFGTPSASPGSGSSVSPFAPFSPFGFGAPPATPPLPSPAQVRQFEAARQASLQAAREEADDGFGLGDIVHGGLDAAGVLLPPADAVNGAIYAAEGNEEMAAINFAGIVPGAKETLKGKKAIDDIASSGGKAADEAFSLSKTGDELGATTDEATAIRREAQAYQAEARSGTYTLTKNMEEAGLGAKPAGAETHHIVPKGAYSTRSDLARGYLEQAQATLHRLGLGPEDAQNGVFLERSAHRSIHTDKYFAALNKELSVARTPEEATEALERVRKGLENGTFPH